VAAFLLERGADPHALVRVASENATSAHYAVWAGRPDTMRFLVEHGVNPSLRDPVHQSTAIGWAVYLKKDKVLEYLVTDPERIDMRDAAEVNHLERLRELLGDGDPDQGCCGGEPGVLLRAAAAMGNLACAEFLLERGADPSIKNSTGQTPADYARLFGQDKMLEFLANYPRS
jgi:ankyrin repeat protein